MKFLLPALVVCVSIFLPKGVFAEDGDDTGDRERRAGLSMLRLGRSFPSIRTRGIRMLRLGKRAHLSEAQLRDFIFELLENEKQLTERQAPLPRYGKDVEYSNGLERRTFPMFEVAPLRPVPRLGRLRRSAMDEDKVDEDEKDSDERAVPIPRIGRDEEEEEDKLQDDRAVPIPRIGREQEYPEETAAEKRAMRMLRLGRGMSMLRLGKRKVRMLRLGKKDDNDHEIQTRGLAMLRLG